MTLIAEARNGLTEREKALIEDAIATEHPWVSAIYDECRETGDMRGLMVREYRRFQHGGDDRGGGDATKPKSVIWRRMAEKVNMLTPVIPSDIDPPCSDGSIVQRKPSG